MSSQPEYQKQEYLINEDHSLSHEAITKTKLQATTMAVQENIGESDLDTKKEFYHNLKDRRFCRPQQ